MDPSTRFISDTSRLQGRQSKTPILTCSSFCPAYHAPLREKQPLLPAALRFDMLKVIAAENDRMEVSSLELDKQKTCYTYNTVQEIQQQYPTSKIMLILGSDQFNRLSEWKFCKELANLCHFLVFSRTTTHIH